MKKILLSLFVSLFFIHGVQANEIDKYIKKNGFELKSTVSIFAKKNNKVVYKKHPQKGPN